MNPWSAPSEMPSHDTAPDLTRFANAVFSEGKSLLLVRSDADALHRISQSLQALWLTRAPQLKVEHFSGRLSAGLLGLINTSLAEQALPAVMQGGPHEPLQHLCMVHDAEWLSQDELLLLQRVIEHFPGWKTRLVLLFKTSLDTSEKLHALLQQPGKGLLIWQVHTSPTKPAASTTSERHRRWWLGLLALTVLGAAWAWLQRPAKETASTAPLAGSSPATPLPPKGQDTVATTAAEKAPLPAAPATGSDAPAPAQAATAQAATAQAAQPPVPDVAMRGHRWLSGLPGHYFVIAHASHERLALALRQIETKSELSTARIIMLNPTATQASRFLVVSGPFRSLERAQNFKVRQKLPASAEIHEVSAVLDASRPRLKASR